MTDDQQLANLSISHDGESFGSFIIPCLVLFEIADGRKGAIKARAVNSSRLLVDIKIQKY